MTPPHSVGEETPHTEPTEHSLSPEIQTGPALYVIRTESGRIPAAVKPGVCKPEPVQKNFDLSISGTSVLKGCASADGFTPAALGCDVLNDCREPKQLITMNRFLPDQNLSAAATG